MRGCGDTATRRDQMSRDTKSPLVRGGDDPGRRAFTAALIGALEDAAVARAARSPQQLADAAYAALQWDLPDAEPAELHALAQILRTSLEGKAGWPAYPLTAKLLENVVAGTQSVGVVQEPCCQAYRSLCCTLLLGYARKLFSLPEEQAWALLHAFEPQTQTQIDMSTVDDQQQEQQQEEQQQEEQQQEEQHQQETTPAAAAQAMQCTSSAAAVNAAVYAPPADDVLAACPDEDGDEYEPLEQQQQQQELLQPAASNLGARIPPSSRAAAPNLQLPLPPYPGWEALEVKLLSLVQFVAYEHLSDDALWSAAPTPSGGGAGGGATSALLGVLRAIGVHPRAATLSPLLHAYVGVLLDRAAAAPDEATPLLSALWDALGLPMSETAAAAAGAAGQMMMPRSRSGAALLPSSEALLGLGAAAAAWARLPHGPARRALWRACADALLPLLGAECEQLAAAAAAADQAAGSAGQPALAAGERLARALLSCSLLERLLLERPVAVDLGRRLTDAGATRGIALLFAAMASEQAAEPVRRVALFAACSSPDVASWMLAAAPVQVALSASALACLGGPGRAHRVLWQLVQGKSGAAADLAAALLADGRDSGDLLVLLQLMVDAQQVAGPTRALYPEGVRQALRVLCASLKTQRPPASQADPAADSVYQNGSGRREGGSSSDSETDDDVSAGRQPRHSQAALDARRAMALQPTALRLAKQLLEQGSGGKTD